MSCDVQGDPKEDFTQNITQAGQAVARRLIEANLNSRMARRALPPGVHWRRIDATTHLGYRNGPQGGRWLVRWFEQGHYRKAVLGPADDIIMEGNISFDAAVKRAAEHVVAVKRGARFKATITVKEAMDAYMAVRDKRASAQAGRAVKSDAHSRLNRHFLSDIALAKLPLRSLTEEQLAKWRKRLPATLKATTRQRLLSDVKAALNMAWREHRKSLPPEFAHTISFGLSTADEPDDDEPVARENQILTDDQVRSIIKEAQSFDEEGDFARMVMLLAATGARFSQVRRLQVRDVQLAQARIMMPTSRKGRSRRKAEYTPIQIGRDVIEALAPVIVGRQPGDPLLQRWRHVQTGSLEWKRTEYRQWQSSSEMLRPWHMICEKLELADTVPYALRHSSIVRGLRAGLPIRLVASNHDTSVQMIERHYARYIADGLEELSAKAVIPLLHPVSNDQQLQSEAA